ncbi:PAS domain-containing sensor histidine kinase [Couchioplanes azureus]|uniref:PAS domain-containing sensor histidine kinase n=1 Tax=Couchioplanes caeruleus TaxID=56438 RepID=UPI0019849A5E|nr:ATP-binding protein [Couchioplanes caeruleus]GGQ62887.1 hypothetical protein GCM10010166_35840 [Couchioplanes caeruleus subsp. azureus]
MGESQPDIDYRALFRGSPAGMVALSPELVIMDVSDAYLAATMRTREELVGRPLFEAFPDNPADPAAGGVAALDDSLQRVLRDGVTDMMAIQKYDIPRPGGGFETRYWAPVSAPVFGPDARLAYVVHRVEDVTAYVQGRQEEAGPGERADQLETEAFDRSRLQEQHRTLQALADSLDTAVIGCDTTGRPVLSNEAARTLTGDRLRGAPAEQWPRRLHLHEPDGRPLSATDHPLVRALHGEHVRDAEVVMRPPGAPPRIFRMHGRPVTGRPGLAAVVTMHDVTVHRRTARLKECELQVGKIISAAAPTDDVMTHVVRVIGAMTGWEATEFWTVDEVAQVLRRTTCWAAPGRDLPCRLPDPLPAYRGLPGRAWRTQQPAWTTDLSADAGQAADWGPLRAALAVPVPSGSDMLGVLVCYSDTPEVPDDTRTALLTGIGAQVGGFLERRRAQSLAAELDRTRDEFIALVGHELRTPLTNVQSYADFLLDDPGVAGDHRQMLEVIHRNAASLQTVVAKLLDVAGLRSGHIDLHLDRTDLAEIVRAAARNARTGDGITVDVNAPAAVPVDGDPHRLRQVVDELLHNALTWATDGSTVGITVHTDEHATTLAVSNTGNRIPAQERAHLFDLFFRGDAARHCGVPGAGLGLTLARAIVEQHGGSISVNDPAESATVFTVRLPTRLPRTADGR